MKKACAVLSLLLIAGVSGCAAFPAYYRPIDTAANFKITVTSNPAGAEIYVNDRLMGVTPSDNVLVVVPMKQYAYFAGSDFMPTQNEALILRVSKKGYKPGVEPMEIVSVPSPSGIFFSDFGLKKARYHFELVPEDTE